MTPFDSDQAKHMSMQAVRRKDAAAAVVMRPAHRQDFLARLAIG
jgi:hypothetical protein